LDKVLPVLASSHVWIGKHHHFRFLFRFFSLFSHQQPSGVPFHRFHHVRLYFPPVRLRVEIRPSHREHRVRVRDVQRFSNALGVVYALNDDYNRRRGVRLFDVLFFVFFVFVLFFFFSRRASSSSFNGISSDSILPPKPLRRRRCSRRRWR